MGVMRISAHSLTSDVGIGSRPQDLDGEDLRILSRLSSDTAVKYDSVLLVELGLVTEDGVDDWSVDLILRILSEKKLCSHPLLTKSPTNRNGFIQISFKSCKVSCRSSRKFVGFWIFNHVTTVSHLFSTNFCKLEFLAILSHLPL